MNLSYANRPEAYWTSSASSLQCSSVMQPIPTVSQFQSNEMHTQRHQTTLFKPYNHFPITVASTYNGLNIQLNEPRISAFKPVKKSSTNSNDASNETAFKSYGTESSYQPLRGYRAIAPKIYDSAGDSSNSSSPKWFNNSSPLNLKHNEVTITHSTSNKLTKSSDSNEPKKYPTANIDLIPVENTEQKAVIKYRYVPQDSPNGKVYQWESLLPFVPEPLKKSETTVSLKKSHTKNSHQKSNDTQQNQQNFDKVDVPIIDLTTTNEDYDMEFNSDCSRSMIESNVTPPLDVNGNEILIKTDTKTMQAISYRKACRDNSANVSPSPKRNTVNCCPKELQCSLHNVKRAQNGRRTPLNKQTKMDNRYYRWLRYLRSYSGFRLFAQRYYTKAQAIIHTQAHANAHKRRLMIEATLLKWWNSLSPIEREQYVQYAEIRKRQLTSASSSTSTSSSSISSASPPTAHKSPFVPTNSDNKIDDERNLSPSIVHDLSTNSKKTT